MEYTELSIKPQLCLKHDEQELKNLDLMQNYILERKYDGTRVLAHIGDTSIKLFTRNGKSELSSHYPEIVNTLRDYNIPSGTIIDGELIFYNNNTNEIEFQSALITPENANQRNLSARFVVFDIPYKNGESIMHKSLLERKDILQRTIGIETPNVCISTVYDVPEKYYDIFEHEVKSGREGVVAKLKDSKYIENARNATWLKFKRHDTMDCIVIGITEGTGKYNTTFGALILGTVIDNELRVCGYCSGLTDEERESMYEMIMKKPQYIYNKKFSKPVLKTIKPDMVVEVEYMERTEYNMLRHPRFVRIRHDKTIDVDTKEICKNSGQLTLDAFGAF